MKLFNHVIELNFRAKRGWTDPVFVRRPYWSHFVIGKLSLIYGQPHLEPVRVCSDCGEEIQGKSAGDESWDWCESCQQVEGPTHEITMEEFEAAQ